MGIESDCVVAATAGRDTWKTRAGRLNGPERATLGDLWRVPKNLLLRKMGVWGPPSTQICPVCLVSANQWHISSVCGHAACRDCVVAYARSRIASSQTLMCPCCPRPLSSGDAVQIMVGSTKTLDESSAIETESSLSLVDEWDLRLRDAALQEMPDFRPCPFCEGGGTVSSDCMRRIYSRRARTARIVTVTGRRLFYGACVFFLWWQRNGSFVCVTLFFFINFRAAVARWTEAAVRRLIILGQGQRGFLVFKKLTVECPCCEKLFALNAADEFRPFATLMDDHKTRRWITSRTKPCPRCRVSIHKDGGCNHVVCTRCRAQFCWACLRIGTKCQAYRCLHGGRAQQVQPWWEGRRQPQQINTTLYNDDHNEILATLISMLLYGVFTGYFVTMTPLPWAFFTVFLLSM